MKLIFNAVINLINVITKLVTDIKEFFNSMFTNPTSGDVSSKRVNGTELIQAAIVLGFLVALNKQQLANAEVALNIIYAFLIAGLAFFGITIVDNFKRK